MLFSPGISAQQEDLSGKLQVWEISGQSDSVDYYYPQLGAAYQSVDNLADYLYAYWDWQAYWFDNHHKALAILDTVLTRQWRTPVDETEGEALLWIHLNRGYHLGEKGNVLSSTKAYEQAMQLYQTYGFDFFDAVDYLFLPLGAHYTRLGDNEKARGIYLKALKIASIHQDTESLAGLYNNLGLTYWNAGNYAKAIEHYLQGLKLPDLPELQSGLLHLSLAQSHFDNGEDQKARNNLMLAESLLEKTNATDQAVDYQSGVHKLYGDYYTQKNQFVRAEAHFNQALNLAQQVYGDQPSRDRGKIYISLGQLYSKQNKFNEALHTFNRAIQSVLPAFLPGNADDNPSPDQLYEENTLLEALAGKGDVYISQYYTTKNYRLLQEALTCFELAYKVENKLRASFQYESSKLTLLADSRRRTEKVIDILWECYQHSPDEAYVQQALEWMEKAKAIVLLDALQDNLARNAIQTNDSLLLREQMIKQQLAYFNRQLILHPKNDRQSEWQQEKFQLEQELDQIETQLIEKYPNLQNFRTQDQGLDWAVFRQNLLPDPSTFYLSYFAGERRVYGVIIGQKGQSKFANLGSTDSLQQQVTQFLQQLSIQTNQDNIPLYQKRARNLSSSLLAPLLPATEETQTKLCITPDSWLGFLPFEALIRPGNSPNVANWRQVDFLLLHYQVHYVYSASVALAQMASSNEAKRTAQLVAPLFKNGQRQLAPLPGSADELSAIAPACSETLLGDAASHTRVLDRIDTYHILHFSTHAQADSSGQGPRIELFDQPLYLPEIYALRLQASMVVLSACESGIGRVEKGEGVMSLARAFTYAGATSLVSSLWSVNAQATTSIMKNFYDHLWSGQVAASALHQAKIDYLKSKSVSGLYKSPYYWTGFVYIGPPSVNIQTQSSFFCGRGKWIGGVILLLITGWWWRRPK